MPLKSNVAKSNLAPFLAVLLFALFAAATLLWLSLDRVPPNWDDAWYLTKSLTVYDSLTQHGLPGYLSSLNSTFGFKAPLIAALPAPLYLVFGRRWHAAYLVNIAAMLLLFAALYRIGCRWWTPRAAVFAIAVAGTMPLLYGLARWYLVEYALTALVAAAVAVLMESDSLDRSALAFLFGAICGFGLMLKAAFVIFLFPPFLFAWIGSRRRARSLMLAAIPCLAIALPWYAAHWRPVLDNAIDAGFGAPAAVQGTGPIFSIAAILTYLERVARTAVSVYYAILAVALLAFPKSRKKAHDLRFLLFWLLPFPVFLFGGNKDVRYIAPILPAVALLIAALLDSVLPRNRAGAAIGISLLAFPLLSLFAVSFRVPWRAQDLVYARLYAPQTWPHDEIVRLIASNISPEPGQRPLLLVGSDRAALNANNIELTAVALHLPLTIETTAHEPDNNTLLDRLDQSAFFLYKEGGEPESAVFNPHLAALIQRVQTAGTFTEIPYGRRLPDGGTARIFRRSLQPPTVQPPLTEEFVIDFGGVLALISTAVERWPASVTVRYVWRRLRPSPNEYWSFTHLIDPAGKIVAQLDQPLPFLAPGRVGQQRIRVALPAGVSSSTLRLRFGLYDPLTSTRLPIGSLPSAAAPRFKLTGTALIAPI
jgi:Dolichyl-phosphate-mannose-protein mannosyltransferase